MNLIPLNLKLAFSAIVFILITTLSFGIHYYQRKYTEALVEIAVMASRMKGVEAVANDCSNATDKLQKDMEQRASVAAKAIAESQALAKKNEAFAQSLLQKTPLYPNDLCKASVELFQEYKTETEVLK